MSDLEVAHGSIVPSRYDRLVALLAQPWGEKCILWDGSVMSTGYGEVRANHKSELTHRVACRLAHGAPPAGLSQVAHSCGVRRCVNPNHLRWTNQSGNEADKVTHGLSNRGERCGTHKLSEAQMREVRERYAAGGITQKKLGAEFGIKQQGVSNIVTRKTWRHFA